MEFKHESVLLRESVEGLRIKADGIYVDGTTGGGGHSYEIAKCLTDGGRLICFDKDLDAIGSAKERLREYKDRITFVHSDFSQAESVLNELGMEFVDGVLLDLGTSSYQFDNPERGFSYMHDGALDMRMDATSVFTASDVVNGYTERELAVLIREYGEERWAERIARFIVEARPIETTHELVEVIKSAIPAAARRTGPHPAKRTFQAIRIEVNGELDVLEEAIDAWIPRLNIGGRLAIISFHSLEDRIVKNKFRDSGEHVVTKKPIAPSEEEIEHNPRARSAKLRVLEKSGERQERGEKYGKKSGNQKRY